MPGERSVVLWDLKPHTAQTQGRRLDGCDRAVMERYKNISVLVALLKSIANPVRLDVQSRLRH